MEFTTFFPCPIIKFVPTYNYVYFFFMLWCEASCKFSEYHKKKETTDIIISYIFANLIFNYLLFLPHKLWVDHAGHPSTYLQSEKKLDPTGEFKPGSPDTKTSILPARQR